MPRKDLAAFYSIPLEQSTVQWREDQAIASHPLFRGEAIDRFLGTDAETEVRCAENEVLCYAK